jgi:hypothetical protein
MVYISLNLNSEHLLQTFFISDTSGTQYKSREADTFPVP